MLDTTVSWMSGLFGSERKQASQHQLASNITSGSNRCIDTALDQISKSSKVPRSHLSKKDIKKLKVTKALAATAGAATDEDWIVLYKSAASANGVSGEEEDLIATDSGNDTSSTEKCKSGSEAANAANPEAVVDPTLSRKSKKEASRIKNAKLTLEAPIDRGKEMLAALKDREQKLMKTRKMSTR